MKPKATAAQFLALFMLLEICESSSISPSLLHSPFATYCRGTKQACSSLEQFTNSACLNSTLEGETLFEAVGGGYPPFIKSNKPSQGLALIEPAMEILYNDCEPDAELDGFMKPHALRAFETKPSAPAWKDEGFDGRRLYIRTIKDQCNPASLQVGTPVFYV